MVLSGSTAHKLPFAVGSGFVAQKNKVSAVFVSAGSVTPRPVARHDSSVHISPLPLSLSEVCRLPGGDVDCTVAMRIPLSVRTGFADLTKLSNPD